MSTDINTAELMDKICDTSNAFRLGILNHANESFVDLIDEMTAGLAELDGQAKIIKMNKIITSIMSAHQRGDYIGLADELEFQLKPFLEEIEYEPKG